jgi:hypothetical protein
MHAPDRSSTSTSSRARLGLLSLSLPNHPSQITPWSFKSSATARWLSRYDSQTDTHQA